MLNRDVGNMVFGSVGCILNFRTELEWVDEPVGTSGSCCESLKTSGLFCWDILCIKI